MCILQMIEICGQYNPLGMQIDPTECQLINIVSLGAEIYCPIFACIINCCRLSSSVLGLVIGT